MQKDFHYCAIKYIAIKAGFSSEEAQIIAFASQYVDDATEHKKILIKNMPDLSEFDYPSYRFEKGYHGMFDPICTAHKLLQYITAGLSEKAQKDVYISFHFIPDDEYTNELSYDFKVKANGVLARTLVENAIKEVRANFKNTKKYIQKLVKLGIALHTYADTWAHQTFSGRLSHKDNDVDNIEYYENQRWIKQNIYDILRDIIIPDIGHIDAGSYPDYSHIEWKFKKESSNSLLYRNNTKIFLDAAESIYNYLRLITNESDNWDYHKDKCEYCLNFQSRDIDDKITNWKRSCPSIIFDYEQSAWKNNNYVDMKWFYFHIEAYKQRQFVLNAIK